MTMIERMARAELSEDPYRDSAGNEIAWESLQPHTRDMCLRRARAALVAMREPSAGMCKVLGVFPDPPVKHDDPDKAIKLAPILGIYHIWNGLIDAALAEGA